MSKPIAFTFKGYSFVDNGDGSLMFTSPDGCRRCVHFYQLPLDVREAFLAWEDDYAAADGCT